MIVFVFDPREADCDRLAASLRSAGHEVQQTSSEATALTILTAGDIEVGLLADSPAAMTLAKKARVQDGGRRPQLLLLAKDTSEAHLIQAYENGFDSEVRMPSGVPFLYARLAATSRAVQRARIEALVRAPRASSPLEAVSLAASGATRA
jgi:DNA-binding response OmpR family regulator